MEHRVTVLESDVATLKENRAEDRIMLSAIQKDIHAISLTIASGKGWVIGVIGFGVLLASVAELAIKFLPHS